LGWSGCDFLIVLNADHNADLSICVRNAVRDEESNGKNRGISFLRFGKLRLTGAGKLERGKVVECTNKTVPGSSNEVCMAQLSLLRFYLVQVFISAQLSLLFLTVA